MNDSKIELLSNIQLFSSLTDEELQRISSKVRLKEFARHEVILREEDTNEFMYIILIGKVKAVQTTSEGKEIILAIHQADEFFGEISLIDGKTATATVVAAENSLIAFISKRDFHELVYGQNKVLENLLQVLCSRLRESWERIHMLNFNNSSQRIKMLFLTLSYDKGEKTDSGVILKFKMTHQDIANMTGLTRETVTRVIDKWKKDGVITVLENRFIQLNPRFLEDEFAL